MSVKVQLNGTATLIGSKKYSDAEKDRALQAEDGKAKVLRITFVDANGNEVTLSGRLYKSKAGSLTARFNHKVEGCEIVEVEDKATDEQANTDAEDMASLLGL